MNTRQKVEVGLLVALLAATTFSLRTNGTSECPPAMGESPAKGKIVQTVVRHADDPRVSAILVHAPVVVWLLLLLD